MRIFFLNYFCSEFHRGAPQINATVVIVNYIIGSFVQYFRLWPKMGFPLCASIMNVSSVVCAVLFVHGIMIHVYIVCLTVILWIIYNKQTGMMRFFLFAIYCRHKNFDSFFIRIYFCVCLLVYYRSNFFCT